MARCDPLRTLLVLPCSGAKQRGGVSGAGPSTRYQISHHIDHSLAERLRIARQAVAPRAGLDESQLLPAWRRYTGSLYQFSGSALGKAVEKGVHIVIRSGSYGLALATEEIGWYDARFRRSWWPNGLLEGCLVAYSRRHSLTAAISFMSATSAYAELIRGTPWHRPGLQHAFLVTPLFTGTGGAQRSVPACAGEAVAAYRKGWLIPGWHSSSGLGLKVEVLA